VKHKLPQRCTLLAYMGAVAGLMPLQGVAQEQPQTLPEVVVRPAPGTASSTEKYQLPVTTESVTAEQMAETINVINTEDALKYLPSLIVRKRNFGDQQAPLATRTSGLGQSARSLIYADGVLLSTLIGNNNSGASPRWALVSPEEIERVDVMYGPYSAAYPGNSMGAVVDIITRMPQKFEAGVKVLGAVQRYGIYGTRDTYESGQVSAILGNRTGNWSWWLSANHLHSQTQPLTIVTALRPTAPSAAGTPVSGAFMDLNRLGQPIAVLGAGGLETKNQDTLKAKIAYDFSPEWRATYALGYFQNDANSKVETYLRNAAGQPVYSGASLNIAGFNYNIPATAFSSTNGFYNLDQQHIAQSLLLKSNMQRNWDWEGVVSYMRFGIDTFRVPGTALPEASAGGPGTIVSMGGTEWYTADLKGLWRPGGPKGVHQVSFGAHYDHYRLVNTTFATPNWIAGPLGGPVTANSLGKTETSALWLQDAWQFAPQLKLTLGARQEYWRAYDGLNFTAAPASNVLQPNITSTKFSPKASVAWQPDKDTRVAFSYGTAYRFPTVSELYQAVTVGGVVFTPNPNLRPERAYSGELAIERAIEKGRVRASLFQENLKDALISQNSTIPGTNVIGASVQNIDRIRSRGIELLADRNDVLIRGLELYATVTYVDSEIRSDPGFRNVAGVLTNVSGKNTPNIPKLKWTAVATYRYDQQLSGTVAARHSDRVWATIDNTDIYTHTYQGFDSYTVFDARMLYQLTRQWSAALGVENLGNRKYFLFHPFPQRTFVAELKFAL
jgi:iron complex outermembrane receptor protein